MAIWTVHPLILGLDPTLRAHGGEARCGRCWALSAGRGGLRTDQTLGGGVGLDAQQVPKKLGGGAAAGWRHWNGWDIDGYWKGKDPQMCVW